MNELTLDLCLKCLNKVLHENKIIYLNILKSLSDHEIISIFFLKSFNHETCLKFVYEIIIPLVLTQQ